MTDLNKLKDIYDTMVIQIEELQHLGYPEPLIDKIHDSKIELGNIIYKMEREGTND